MRPGDLRRLVGEDIAEHIRRHNDIKLGRIADQLHRSVIHQHIRTGDIGIVRRDAMDRLPPEPGGFQDIGLVDADDLLAALAGRLKRDAGDPLDLHHAVAFGIIGLRAVLAIAAAPLAEVDAAGQLPDHHQVKAVGDDIGPQRAITCQGRVEFCGAQIRIKAQGRPQTEQRFVS